MGFTEGEEKVVQDAVDGLKTVGKLCVSFIAILVLPIVLLILDAREIMQEEGIIVGLVLAMLAMPATSLRAVIEAQWEYDWHIEDADPTLVIAYGVGYWLIIVCAVVYLF